MPVNGRLVLIYTIAAFYAGVAGGLVAQTTRFGLAPITSPSTARPMRC